MQSVTANTEFWRGFIFSMLRKGLAVVGTILATHGWISTDQADGLTTTIIVEFVLAILLTFGSSLWTWMRENFNVRVKREARASATDTPIGIITAETLAKSDTSLISSV